MIATIKGINIQIDPEDAWVLSAYSWFPMKSTKERTGNYYFACTTARPEKKTLLLHRTIMGLGRMTESDRRVVDHINGDTLDMRKCNLRLCSAAENGRNRKLHKNSTSGLKGAYPYKPGVWAGKIRVDKVLIHLGYFRSPEAAHAAYCVASEKYHGEFGRTE